MVATIGIRVLAGGNYDDIMNTLDISKGGFCHSRNKFMKASVGCKWLDMSPPPAAPEEWEQKREGFSKKSANQAHEGCTGASDVFFQPTQRPTMKESDGNPRARCLGHCQSHGLNCQATCNSRLRFLLFAVVTPGQANDAVAHEATGLHETIAKLPSRLRAAGDAACVLTEHLLVPFTGSCRCDPNKDSCNFCLSQLRIKSK